jgi:hypothetical protein
LSVQNGLIKRPRAREDLPPAEWLIQVFTAAKYFRLLLDNKEMISIIVQTTWIRKNYFGNFDGCECVVIRVGTSHFSPIPSTWALTLGR